MSGQPEMEKSSTDNHATEASVQKDVDGSSPRPCKAILGLKRFKSYLSCTEFGNEGVTRNN